VSTFPTIDPALQMTLRGALALLFFWAAAHKLRDVTGFRAALAAYALLPDRVVASSAAVLIAIEVGVGAGLLPFGEPGLSSSAALAAGLLCMYSAAIAINLLRGRRHIDCGCVGAATRRPLTAGLLVRNAVLISGALAGALPATARSLTTIDGVTTGAGIATLALLYIAVDGLIANAPRLAVLARDHVPHGPVETNRRQVDHA